jgi:hypothetical protein
MIDRLSRRSVRRLALVLAAAVMLFGAAAAADVPAKIGPEFQVNTFTDGSQLHPDVARFPDGHFVVVWQDLEGSPVRVKSRLYEASGAPASGELAVTHTVPASSPRVTALPDGGFAVVWEDSNNVNLRRFDREGQPLYPLASAVVVNEPSFQPSFTPDIASNSAGTLAVVWIRPLTNQILLRRLDAAGNPLGASVQVNTFATGLIGPHVAMNDAGSVLVSWGDTGLNKVRARRFDGPSGTWSKEVTIEAPGGSNTVGNVPVLYPEGDGAVVFSDFRSVDIRVFAQQMDAAGALKGVASEIGGPLFFTGNLDAAIDAAGNAFVVWVAREGNASAISARIHGRLLDRSWRPVGGELTVSTGDLGFYDEEPAVAADASGGVVTVWSDVGEFLGYPSLTILPGKDGSEFGVFGQLLDPACVADSEVLCLGAGNRFRVRVSWKIPGGETGVGRSHPLTADTGALWFFSPDNLELMIKVLDGRPVNGHFWVFYGALSNVEYTITVTDTATGKEKTYHNAPGQLPSRADTSAFEDAAAVPAAAVAVAAPAAAATGCPIFITDTTLCLQSGRFFAEVTFTDPRNGTSGPGHALGLTSDTGTFWFFDSSNLELMIKVLDGRAVNGHFWVFFGALSNVAYTIKVTDTETGEQRTYVNPRGQLASRADTSAFPVGH